MHKLAFRLVLAFALLLAASVGATAARAGDDSGFLSIIEDLPLMPGLEEERESALVFDTPSGRIAETYASGAAAPSEIARFYAETLPQLGWEFGPQDEFLRDGEVLHIEFETHPEAILTPGLIRVRFGLAPVGPGPLLFR